MSTHYREYSYTTATAAGHDYLVRPLLKLLGPPQGRILDLGCGNGALARELFQRGYDVHGVDASHSGIAIANAALPGRFHWMDFATGTWPAALQGQQFQTVLSTEVIEHLYAPATLLELAAAALVPQGHLIVTTPYHGYLKNLCLALAGRLDAHFTALWDGGHIKFFSRRTLTALLARQGFTVLQFEGAGRLPWLWKSMLVKAAMAPALAPAPAIPAEH